MKIRYKLILPIVAIFIFAAVGTIFSIKTTVSHLVSANQTVLQKSNLDALAEKAALRRDSIDNSIKQLGGKALELSSLFSQIPDVQTAYGIMAEGNLNDENDASMQAARDMLRVKIAPYLAGYKKNNGTGVRVHYHTPNGRSLVRLWRKGWQAKRNGKKVDISDDLTSFRKSVMQINSGNHSPLSGIEVGRGGFALRGLSAITDANNNHLGSCEVLLPFAEVVKANHLSDRYQLVAYMMASELSIATKLQNPQKYPVLDGRYVLVSSTNKKVTSPIVTAAILDAGSNNASDQIVDNAYVTTFPIKDFSGKHVGVMAIIYDMSDVNAVAAAIERSSQDTIHSVEWRYGVGGLVLVLLLVLIVFSITSHIVNPLQTVVGVAKDIATGDLTASIQFDRKDAIGELANTFNRMIDGLKQKSYEASQIAQGDLRIKVAVASDKDEMGKAFATMVDTVNAALCDVNRVAMQIDAGSQQVAATAQQLSDGASTSAASLEEVSSSMSEINGQTTLNADNALMAKNLATGAKDAASVGSKHMSQMVSAMDEINLAGQNIGKIIKVIDEIAFQTNLLALNAAVEAARAGQHGKGFAVVAEEVRNLAARSAKAAAETAELIEGSVEKTRNGADIAQKTATSLEEIVESTNKVADLVSEIAAAGNEQAQGIAQISQGLVQIDQAVQQNTATAEESAAASQELSGLAAQLRQTISIFKLSESTGQTNGNRMSIGYDSNE